jgi:hypothetical protein
MKMENKTIEQEHSFFQKSFSSIIQQMWEEDDEVRLILLVNAVKQLKRKAEK